MPPLIRKMLYLCDSKEDCISEPLHSMVYKYSRLKMKHYILIVCKAHSL